MLDFAGVPFMAPDNTITSSQSWKNTTTSSQSWKGKLGGHFDSTLGDCLVPLIVHSDFFCCSSITQDSGNALLSTLGTLHSQACFICN